MNFLSKLNLRRFAKVAAVAAVSGTLLFGGNDAVVNAAPDGMAAFREVYTAQNFERTFSQSFILYASNFHLEMNAHTHVSERGAMQSAGNITWTYTNLKKNYSTNNTIPFYIDQTSSDMILYVQRHGTWSKMLMPGLPSGIAVMWQSNDPQMNQQIINAVKAAEVINETPEMRIMNVTLDGKKVADILSQNSQASFSNLKGDALAYHQEIFKRWITAIQANDITFTWTVSKKNWETITAVFDLTNVMRSYARYVLDEAAAGRIVLTDEERELLDAMGYYAELKSYTSKIESPEKIQMTQPSNPDAVPEDDDALDDIFSEMTTVVKK